jgi:hypothetical protein
MLRIDHFCVGVRHLYEGASRLRAQTGLDPYDGGWFHDIGLAQRTVPLGNDCYMEIESVICHPWAVEHRFGRWFESVISQPGDHFMGLVLAVDSLEELEAAAKRMGTTVARTWGRVRPDDQRNMAYNTALPDQHPWPRGLPVVMYWPDMSQHPDRIPQAATVNHRVTPKGIASVEVGGQAELRKWLGPEVDSLPVRYVDAPPGLRAVGIATDGDEIVLRLAPAPYGEEYRRA